jgi:hypothetical protein
VQVTTTGKPTSEPSADPLRIALEALDHSRVGRDLVRFLGRCEGRTATFDQIAVEHLKSRKTRARHRWPTIRQQAGRARAALDKADSPIRIEIINNSVRLVDRGG